MKTTLFALFALVLALCLVQQPLPAQSAFSASTTLSAAQTQNATNVFLTSVTGMSSSGPGNQIMTMIYVDRELEAITLVPTTSGGTTANVQRGQAGTPITSHASGATVLFGPPSYFPTGAPSGSCTPPTTYAATPVIDVSTGNLYQCSTQGGTTAGYWVNFAPFVSRLVAGPQITAAATITITSNLHLITGATTITTISGPSALPLTGGCIRLLPLTAGYTSSTGGNVGLASTLVTGKILEMCNVAGVWYPSY
jgi:hypothetical protein